MLRFHLAVLMAKCAQLALRLLGRKATHAPGVVALTVCPRFLEAAPKPALTVCVTGTNGKTTVSNLIADALIADGKKVVENREGANIAPGCAVNLLNALTLGGKCRVDAAVFEVDERASRLILPPLQPDYLVVTGLFRDSLKRNAHPDYIFSIINTYCPDKTKLILNADELCSSLLKPDSQRTYFGIGRLEGDHAAPYQLVADHTLCPRCGAKLRYDYLHYHHIGHAACPQCDFRSFDADYLAETVDAEAHQLTVRHGDTAEVYPLISDILFNVYNEMAVITLLRTLGISAQRTAELIAALKVPSSRLDSVCVGGVNIVMAMSKGQSCVSSCRTFDIVANAPGKKSVVLMMDDYYDRKKSVEYIGWIYDVDYEVLSRESVVQVVAAGPRCLDHKVRLLLAGVAEENITVCNDDAACAGEIDTAKADTVYLLYDTSTYDVACAVRKELMALLEKEGK